MIIEGTKLGGTGGLGKGKTGGEGLVTLNRNHVLYQNPGRANQIAAITFHVTTVIIAI